MMPEDKNPEQSMIFSGQGNPFKTDPQARKEMKERGLDSKDYKVQSVEDGYVIVPKPKKVQEKYWWVIFAHRQDPGDTIDVPLMVNGDVLVCQRGVKTCIPDRFRECADHTTIPVFEQRPNEARKEVGLKQTYPYTVVGEATEQEYKSFLSEGNKKTREALKADRKLIS